MKRLELFEFEDFNWLPSVIRNGATNLVVVFHTLLGTVKVLSNLILKINEKVGFDQINDLGSGAGGPMIGVIDELNKRNSEHFKTLILSDYYPNKSIVDEINRRQIPNVTYLESSVDATNMKNALSGLKTMIACFHHMRPLKAQKILLSAQKNKEPILIYEIAKNNIPVLVWWFLLPLSLAVLFLMALFMTPFI